GRLGLRAPAHDAILKVLRLLPGPVVLSTGDAPGGQPITTAGALLEAAGDAVDVVLDDGPSYFGRAATAVRVSGGAWEVLREGGLSRDGLERQSACLVVFVCTGNTCRSPLAEGLCKEMLARRLGCAVDDLPRRGFLVLSAGLAAMMGGSA